jgi:hypothetical protein
MRDAYPDTCMMYLFVKAFTMSIAKALVYSEPAR